MKGSDEEIAMCGLAAFRACDYEASIACFAELSKRNARAWDHKLYLAMAYSKAGLLGNSLQEFRDIAEFCPLKETREKALTALRLLNKQMAEARCRKSVAVGS